MDSVLQDRAEKPHRNCDMIDNSQTDRATLISRNIDALRRVLPPDMLQSLSPTQPTPLKLVAEEGGELNVDLGGQTLYAGGAHYFTKAQVDRFLADPKRFLINPPNLDSDWIKGERGFYEALQADFGPLPPNPKEANTEVNDPALTVGALVSFGIGLGFHLPRLVRALNFRDLILVEPVVEFMQLSLTCFDWAGLIEQLEGRGGTLTVLLDNNPARLAIQVFEALRLRPFSRIDGSLGYRHYASPALNQVFDQFGEMLPTLGSSKGFVEDECLMLRNAVGNFGLVRAYFAPPDLPIENPPPVIIVGSGPSLDRSIDQIVRLRENAILVSGGTALSALLEHGLRPDLHCEVENVASVYDGVKMTADRYDLSDLTLIGAATLDPRLARLFGQVFFYFPDGITTTHLFAGKTGSWRQAAPSVTNLALRVAKAIGARDVYLFGVDMGAVEPEQHHSNSSYYNWSDDPYWRSAANMDRFDIAVPGNFRDQVFTNLSFLYTKSFFNAFCTSNPEITVHNCSDGARLEGATSQAAETVTLSNRSDMQGQSIRTMLMPFCTPVEVLQSEQDRSVALYSEALVAKSNSIAAAIESAANLPTLLDSLDSIISTDDSKLGGEERAANGFYRGTILLLLQYGFAHYRRMPEGDRERLNGAFKLQLLDQLKRMNGLRDAVFAEVKGSGKASSD